MRTYRYNDSKLFLFQLLYTFRHEIITYYIDKSSSGIVLSSKDYINVCWVHSGKPFDKGLQTK